MLLLPILAVTRSGKAARHRCAATIERGPVPTDRLVNERTGEPFYLVHVAVPDAQLERLGDRRLQPGMPADVMIKTGETTALQYLFQRLLDNLDHPWREE